MADDLTDFEREVLNLIGRHIVSLRGLNFRPNEATNKSEWKPFVASGFLVDIGGGWFLFTAGHVLHLLLDGLAQGVIKDIRLDDGYRPDALFHRYEELPPFDLLSAAKFYVNKPTIGDFAAISLRPMYRQILLRNKVQPFSPQEMRPVHEHSEFDAVWLAGLPAELSVTTDAGEQVFHQSNLSILAVRPISPQDLPDEVKADISHKGSRIDDFFGQLPDEPVNDIEGMSGGPLLAFNTDREGRLRYFVIGVQSGWWDQSRIIRACPITRFAAALDVVLSEARANSEVLA